MNMKKGRNSVRIKALALKVGTTSEDRVIALNAAQDWDSVQLPASMCQREQTISSTVISRTMRILGAWSRRVG